VIQLATPGRLFNGKEEEEEVAEKVYLWRYGMEV